MVITYIGFVVAILILLWGVLIVSRRYLWRGTSRPESADVWIPLKTNELHPLTNQQRMRMSLITKLSKWTCIHGRSKTATILKAKRVCKDCRPSCGKTGVDVCAPGESGIHHFSPYLLSGFFKQARHFR